MAPTAFLIGIDLGTTNTAVAYVDRRKANSEIRLFLVPQIVASHEVQPRRVLPSFLYFGEPHELDAGALALPWDPRPFAVAGVLARERGALAPARQVSSAKSWLAHPGVDRTARLLPWSADPADRRVSPVEASTRYLQHIRDAWNASVAGGDAALRLERQMVVLTVPASFDEEARELTVEAARAAGLEHFTLLEEPLAAFYAWLTEHRASFAGELSDGQIALVCDVGGGTTDFSLIRVTVEEGRLRFERVAIGEHLLLGGDNLDLALAALVEQKIQTAHPGTRLTLLQRHALRRQAADAKERLLGDDPPASVRLTVLGTGGAVVGGALSTELDRDETLAALVHGFLPEVQANERPAARDRHAGLKELGLPYETDPAITRHLAAFLARAAVLIDAGPADPSATSEPMVRPDLVLFNGGFFTPPAARDAVTAVLQNWFGTRPTVLVTNDLAAAVAVGAVHYGWLRATGDRRAMVRAGSARAYYIGVRAAAGDAPPDSPVPAGERRALCLLPRGTDEGTTTTLDHDFTVITNRPIAFTLFSSLSRSHAAGALVVFGRDEALHEHAPLVTVLRYGRKSRHVDLPIRLSVAFTEVGTLELWCESRVSEHRWRLQFQLRGVDQASTGEDWLASAAAGVAEADAAVIPGEAMSSAEALIETVFGGASADSNAQATPENLVATLEALFGYGKTAWPAVTIRRLADVLIRCADGRRQTARHEARWMNLLGFCLRPGFGAAKDPWRVGEARKIYATGLAFPSGVQCRVEWLILWQRAAGGFSAAQQRELAQRVLPDLGLAGRKAPRLNPQVERESWRLAASLERLDAGVRARIGDALVGRIRRDTKNASLLWSIGRLGARTPLCGPLSSVIAPATAEAWVGALLDLRIMTLDVAAAVVQIAAMSGDGLRDLSVDTRRAAAARLNEAGFGEQTTGLIRPIPVTSADASCAFGEPLPEGLRLAADS